MCVCGYIGYSSYEKKKRYEVGYVVLADDRCSARLDTGKLPGLELFFIFVAVESHALPDIPDGEAISLPPDGSLFFKVSPSTPASEALPGGRPRWSAR